MSITDDQRDAVLSYLLHEMCEEYGRPAVRKGVSRAAFFQARHRDGDGDGRDRGREGRDAVDALLGPMREGEAARDVIPELLEVGDALAALCHDEGLLQRWENIRETASA